jgi:predicted AAA+ superfamily ATPase
VAFLEEELKIRTLQEYFGVMLYRDIAERYQVRDTLVLKYFPKRVAENSGKIPFGAQNLQRAQISRHQVGKGSLYAYLDFAESAYFVKLLQKHYWSLVKSELAKKKSILSIPDS